MPETLRVAIAGLVHDHIWDTLEHLRNDGRAILVAVSDDNAPLRRRAVEEYGAAQEYISLDELLERERIDALVCGSENNRHAPIVEAAAARGIHVMVEKPMAATYAQAQQMARVAERSGIVLMINWPTAWNRAIRHACMLVQEGWIGQPFYVKYYAGHNGPREYGCSEYFWSWLYDTEKNGPGALMDYCCYGANLACLLLGAPQSVTGAGGKFLKDYDIPFDNAILLLQYAGAVGVAEASWTQIGQLPNYELVVMGSAGSVVAPLRDEVTLVTADAPNGQPIEAPPLPLGRDNEAAYFLSCLLEGTPPEGMLSPRVCLDAQAVLEAGARAIAEGCAVPLPLQT